jgi:hypothetical protein
MLMSQEEEQAFKQRRIEFKNTMRQEDAWRSSRIDMVVKGIKVRIPARIRSNLCRSTGVLIKCVWLDQQ